MPLMLPPAPRKRAAEASATKAIRRVYSIRSWPCSSFQRLRMNVIVDSLLKRLAGRGVGRGKLAVGGAPDALDAAARAQEKGRGGQRNEGHQKGVLDQVLALLVVPKITHECHRRFAPKKT